MKFVKIATYVLLGILVLLQYPLWIGSGGVITIWRLNREIAVQEQENARLKDRNQAIEADVNDLKQGLAAIEERARMELGMVKKGEIFFQVIDPKPAAMPAAGASRSTRKPASADTRSSKSKTQTERPRTPAP
jgi:cell division protein FtsB